jgi:peptidoglycan/xylan/chitin deacetylase (PgdA/CDA1 family)
MSVLGSIRSEAAPRVKSLLFESPFYTVFRRVLPSRRLAILRYHAICDPDAGYADPGICVSPAAFERHVAYLARHYSVLPLPEAVAALKQGKTLPRYAVAVTFDDGYADNLSAARVLHRFGLSGTFYITAGCLAGEAPFWPAEIRALIPAIPPMSLSLSADGRTVQIPLGTDAERRGAIRTISRLLKGHSIPIRESLREQLRRAAGAVKSPECMLRWEDVVEMSRLGMTIGSHTVTHPNLPNAGAADAWVEIRDSKARLERELGTSVTMFSYPNGGAERYMTPEVASLVKKAGFEAATTSRNAFVGSGSDLYALERVQVSERPEDLVFALEVERLVLQPQPRALET